MLLIIMIVLILGFGIWRISHGTRVGILRWRRHQPDSDDYPDSAFAESDLTRPGNTAHLASLHAQGRNASDSAQKATATVFSEYDRKAK